MVLSTAAGSAVHPVLTCRTFVDARPHVPVLTTHGSRYHDLIRSRPAYGGNRNCPIERHQPPAMLHGERKQVDVGELFRAHDVRAVDPLFVKQRYIVRPEDVVIGFGVSPKMIKCQTYRNGRRIARL